MHASMFPSEFDDKTFLTVNEISRILNQKIATTRTQLRRGQIPGAVKIGKSWKISRALFEEFIRERVPHY